MFLRRYGDPFLHLTGAPNSMTAMGRASRDAACSGARLGGRRQRRNFAGDAQASRLQRARFFLGEDAPVPGPGAKISFYDVWEGLDPKRGRRCGAPARCPPSCWPRPRGCSTLPRRCADALSAVTGPTLRTPPPATAQRLPTGGSWWKRSLNMAYVRTARRKDGTAFTVPCGTSTTPMVGASHEGVIRQAFRGQILCGQDGDRGRAKGRRRSRET